ncbi:MAG: hypothetical protein ACRDD2_11170 [Sarcina sp.]
MSNKLNLDSFSSNSIIEIAGVEYKIPPISYKLAMKFGKIKENDIEKIIEVITEYLNTNKNEIIFKSEELEELLSMKQITELMKFIVGEIANIEKN